ncbi:hypothetical protein CLOM_g1079 [Closterium sp. NIES-68]|nr:hypothetical protein CLOM_g1079 [Closterium sp. NIES-68]GJP69962.1 hypothetical protein CLOP_g954 [Closterium sp. NIES-67]
MAATFLSRLPNVVHIQERLLRLWYMRHGLRLLDVQVDDETSVACWAPRHYADSLARSQSLKRNAAGPRNPDPDYRRASSAGRPKQPLLMLHGFGASAIWQWTNQVAAFSRDFDVLLPDLIFFGGSSSRSDQRSEFFQAGAMLRLLDRLGISECSLVGLSYGGFVAYRMACLEPGRVQRLVLAASGLMTSAEEHAAVLREWQVAHIAELLLPDHPAGVQRLMSLAYAQDAPSLPAWVLRSTFEALFDNQEEKRDMLDEVLKYLAQTGLNETGLDETDLPAASVDGGGLDGQRPAGDGKHEQSGMPPLQELNPYNIPVPEMETLLVWGSCDAIFPLSVAHRMHSHFGPVSSLAVLEGATHALNIHRPKPFNDAVMSFLRDGNNAEVDSNS